MQEKGQISIEITHIFICFKRELMLLPRALMPQTEREANGTRKARTAIANTMRDACRKHKPVCGQMRFFGRPEKEAEERRKKLLQNYIRWLAVHCPQNWMWTGLSFVKLFRLVKLSNFNWLLPIKIIVYLQRRKRRKKKLYATSKTVVATAAIVCAIWKYFKDSAYHAWVFAFYSIALLFFVAPRRSRSFASDSPDFIFFFFPFDRFAIAFAVLIVRTKCISVPRNVLICV